MDRLGGGGVRIAIVGGGPGGLYFAALAKQLAPGREITVWERNAPDDTFGFGVVFSDETLGGIEHADPAVYRAMEREFARWDDIDVHVKGQVITSGGHGFAALSRRRLLEILQQRCRELGVTLRFREQAPDPRALTAGYDLVVAADGANSATRGAFAGTFGPEVDVRRCRYMWLGTDLVFDAFKFYIEQTPHGVMQVHGYPYDATGSTFIVEMPRLGLAGGRVRPDRPGVAGPGPVRRGLDRPDPRAAGRGAGRARGAREQLQVDQLRHAALPASGGTAT